VKIHRPSALLLILVLTACPVIAADYQIDFELPAPAKGFEEADWLAYGVTGVGWITAGERASIDDQVAHGGEQSLKIFFPKSHIIDIPSIKIKEFAFDYIKDEHGFYPVVKSLSEIAGTSSVLIAAEIMAATNKGNGLMFGNITGVPPVEVVILGAGTV